MAAPALKDKVARGTQWTLGEKIATALLHFVVRILVLRLLMPDDLAVLALLMAFASLAMVVVDSGFSQMLVRKEAPTPTDYRSVFGFHLLSSVVIYGLLVALAPLLADYYRMPELREVAFVFFLLIPLNALCVVQQTILTCRFAFARLSKIIFAAQLISGVVAVAAAYAGLGVWALVWQQVLLMGVRAVLLWWSGGPLPKGQPSLSALREMAPYSLSLVASDLITALYNKIPQLFLGRLYPEATLGYYDQAVKLKELPVQSAMQSMQLVTFPALARIADDQTKFAEGFRQVLMVTAYVMFPVMVGMAAVAEDLFVLLLGEQWMPTVPLFEVVCLAGLFTPLAMMAYNVLKVRAAGGLIVRLEVIKKGVMTLLFALSIPHSVEAVVWALVGAAAVECVVNLVAALPLAHLGWGRVTASLLPIAALAAVMYVAVTSIAYLLPDPTFVRLGIEIGVGAVIYIGLSWLFRFEALREILQLIRRQMKQ